MVDNLLLNLGAGGKTLSTDEIAGADFQRMKLALGTNNLDEGTVGLSNPLPMLDGLNIARGVNSNFSHINKFGRNIDIDTVTTEDVWDGGGAWVPPTAARIHDLSSTSGNDTGAGAGAQTVFVEGLDAAGADQSETVTMAGVGNAPTANAYTMIHRMYVLAAGASGQNDGVITATAQVDGTVTAQMAVGNSQTLMAIYQVPASRTGFITGFYYGGVANNTAVVTASIWTQAVSAGSPFRLQHISGGIHQQHFFDPPLVVPAQSIIKARALSDTNNTDVFAGFDIVVAA
jgi:hypothetical protein